MKMVMNDYKAKPKILNREGISVFIDRRNIVNFLSEGRNSYIKKVY